MPKKIDVEKTVKKIIKNIKDNTINISDLDEYKENDQYENIISSLKNNDINIIYDDENFEPITDIEFDDFEDFTQPDDDQLKSLESEMSDNSLNIDYETTKNDKNHNDLITTYYGELTKAPLLKKEQEQELAKDIRAGVEASKKIKDNQDTISLEETVELLKLVKKGEQAKKKLVNSNYRLVISIAKKYDKGNMSFLDLCQEGSMGLLKAADKFDYEKEYKFSTYATWWIRQAITRAIADQGKTIRIPVHMNETINKIAKATRLLTQELGKEPTDEQIAKHLNLPIEKIISARMINKDPISLETPVGEEEDTPLGDFISDPNVITPDQFTNMEMLENALNEALCSLTDREEKVIRMRYGLLDGKSHTLEDVGKEFNVTRERIRQIEDKALAKLKIPKLKDKIKKTYDLVTNEGK